MQSNNLPVKRPLSVVSATTLVAASMIGVGVYTTSGYTLAALGSPGRVIAAWVVGGLIALCGAIGYGALAARFTESGGEYLFLSKTLHPVAGLMAGWVSMLAGFTGAIAIAAIGLEKYFSPMLFESWQTLPGGTIAIAAVVAVASLHTIGVQAAARAQDVVVALKLLMIAGFIVFAFGTVGSWPGLASSSSDSFNAAAFNLLDFANQLVWISFSYAGFNAAVYVSSEVRDPERNVPRALVAGTFMVFVIYVMLNTIFVFGPTTSVITADNNIDQIATTAAQVIGGDRFSLLVRGVIVVSLFTSVSALVMTGPRVYAKMADDGFFPSWFRFEDRPPVHAIWFQAALAIVAISISTLKELLGYLGLTLSVCSALTVSMLFVMRWRGEQMRLPMFGIPPAIYVVATFVLAGLYGYSQPRQALATVITIAVGCVLYPWMARRSPEPDPT
jgi:APA family basic amino acid/polyamine antiporter